MVDYVLTNFLIKNHRKGGLLFWGGSVNQTLVETSCKSGLFKKMYFGMPPNMPPVRDSSKAA